jgi:hypothetical protein
MSSTRKTPSSPACSSHIAVVVAAEAVAAAEAVEDATEAVEVAAAVVAVEVAAAVEACGGGASVADGDIDIAIGGTSTPRNVLSRVVSGRGQTLAARQRQGRSIEALP